MNIVIRPPIWLKFWNIKKPPSFVKQSVEAHNQSALLVLGVQVDVDTEDHQEAAVDIVIGEWFGEEDKR